MRSNILKLKYVLLAITAIGILLGAFIVRLTYKNAQESSLRSCLQSLEGPSVESLTRCAGSERSFGPSWGNLDSQELQKLLNEVIHSGKTDCSGIAGIERGQDVWGNFIRVSVRTESDARILVRIQSLGPDKQENTGDDISVQSR